MKNASNTEKNRLRIIADGALENKFSLELQLNAAKEAEELNYNSKKHQNGGRNKSRKQRSRRNKSRKH